MTMSEFLPKLLDAGDRAPGSAAADLPAAGRPQGASGRRGGSRPAAGRRSDRPRSGRRGRCRRPGDSLGGELQVHDRFGTSTVRLDGFTYDIARTRRETYAQPGALPDVEPAPLAEDLQRRDFTVNAIALALAGDSAGELGAVPAALEDLDARRLRVLHDRSFIDDPTRLLRLVRYATRLRFEIEPHTRALADAAISAGCAAHGQRLAHRRRAAAARARAGPGPGAGRSAPARARYRDPPGLRARRRGPGPPRAGAAAGRRAARPAGAGGGGPRGSGARARRAARLAARSRPRTATRSCSPPVAPARSRAPWRRRARLRRSRPRSAGAPPELVALAGALGAEPQAREWLDRLRHVRLEIDGRDLLAAGVPEGPAIGRGLRAALAAKLDRRASGREQELAEALHAAGERR